MRTRQFVPGSTAIPRVYLAEIIARKKQADGHAGNLLSTHLARIHRRKSLWNLRYRCPFAQPKAKNVCRKFFGTRTFG